MSQQIGANSFLAIHERFMGEALKLARIGLEKGELPIGAVVVLNNEIIAAAHTMEKSEGRLLVHADLLALEFADKIRPISGKRHEAILYVTRYPFGALSDWARTIATLQSPLTHY